MTPRTADWQWIPAYQLYYSASTRTYARPDPATGEWTYLPAQPTAVPSSQGDVVAATGHRLPTTDEPGKGGIGNVGWALDVDVGDSSTGERHVAHREDGPQAAEHAGQGEMVVTETQQHTPPQVSHPEISKGPTTAIHHHPPAPATTPRPHPAPATTPRVLRLVLIQSDILPTHPSSPKIAILDSRQSGYYLARDRSAGKPVLRLKEMMVSKVHAMVLYGARDGDGAAVDGDVRAQGEKGFWVVDCGSTHGTFLLPPSASDSAKPLRLSDARQSSLPHKLEHLARLTIGSTTFECHLHVDWPCDLCALHDAAPLPIDDPSTSSTSTAPSRTATPGTANALDSAVTMPNAAQWNAVEARRVAFTSEAKRVDQARRAGVAMRSLKAQYFGTEARAKANGRGKKAG